ncbi:MAG: thioredoxin family protein [Solobacterium sp.]|nr:thioredoxin family protein [Solobacterium sp.]
MKRILMAVLCILLFTGCIKPEQPAEPTPGSTKISEIYTALPEENTFEIIDQERLTALIEHGTAVVFLGFPECPWCQAYVPYLDEVVKEAGTQVFYYNIYKDKTDDREYYDHVAELINARDDTILAYDNDGKLRIYMPLVLFVQQGEIIGYDNETCMLDSREIKPEEYWTEEKIGALKEKLAGYAKVIAEARKENDSHGCNDDCTVEVK